MAEASYADIVNNNYIQPTSTESTAMAQMDTSFSAGSVLERSTSNPSCFHINLAPATTPNASTVDSYVWKVEFPCRLVLADLNVANLNSATATGDILWKVAGGSYVSVLNAAEALTITAPGARVAPETTAHGTAADPFDEGDYVIFRVIGTGSGAIDNAQARLLIARM